MGHISIQELRKEFGDIVAVDDVSFEIEEGSFTSIVGPSGSGKSTILRMIGGFESPTDGRVLIDGEDVTDEPPFERDVNMVFQDLALFPHMTVGENIAYGLRYDDRNFTKKEREEKIESMLEMVALSGYADRDPEDLSGGEQQRIAVARALVKEPDLLLFDEPLASLDRKLRQRMQTELQRIQAKTGITFLYVTHDQEIALSVSDTLLLLNEGEIEQIGTPETVYEEPETSFAADFVGDVNELPGTVTRLTETDIDLSVCGTNVTVPRSALTASIAQGDQVDVCIRPGEMKLVDPNADDAPILSGTTNSRAFGGEGFDYQVELDETTVQVGNVTEKRTLGEDVHVSWDLEETMVFPTEDPTTGGGKVDA
ncbi:ABC transporter ATP-binding protein [Natrarchaeobius sp. A-rgal3]|uniref:ABC transporter ATP-binding protein n=1 Tax=Natrarchaeobius versutus TaxID=1679078 RepID=UPI0035104D7A